MKHRILPLLLVVTLCLQFVNCNKDDDGFQDPVSVIVPVIKSKSEFRNSIEVTSPQPTNSDGKIYVYDDLLFYIAQHSGIHIFNNENPENPQNMAFIQLEGVNDISIKNNILYADNFMDLVVFDISNVSNIQLVKIEEDMLSFYALFPNNTGYYQDIYPSNADEFISDYVTVTMEKDEADNDSSIYNWSMETFLNNFDGVATADNIGTGGSYAKFQIYDNALYTLDEFKLNTFDITDYNSISLVSENWLGGWLGGELETTFIQKEFLFIGATNGMHIVSLENEFNPTYTSSFIHATGCDPVVVHGNTAYITVRGGNTCGAILDQINVIDISDIDMPTEYSTYFLTKPYGLGIKNDVLYVCNSQGLNVFDAQNPISIVLKNTYEITTKDVIPLPSHLIAVGENVIHQYKYKGDYGLELMSTIQF
ncbi:hypothetical protein [Winogradskyella sp. R77965]|uniref:hypothetical protein n=1 Tax=Winogradskyella sp. R77965 TaxID=3093872 RepID=UPI0037DBF200